MDRLRASGAHVPRAHALRLHGDARRTAAASSSAAASPAEVATPGSLTVVGTGIRLGVQLTPEARRTIESSDEALYLLADAGSAYWIEQLRPGARSLHPLYVPGRVRAEIYEDIVEAILAEVRAGKRVCVALYGHPGVADYIGHGSVSRARREGFDAAMLPAVSAIDCLFADLGIDPAPSGCQIYEATDFVLHRRTVDTTAALVLLQVTAVGAWHAEGGTNREGLAALAEYLRELYAPGHEAIAYEASFYEVADPVITPVRLSALEAAELGDLATLYVPASGSPRADPATLERLRPPS